LIELLLTYLSWGCLGVGSVFYVIGAIGLNRMPDIFTRMHAVSVGDTLGAGFLVLGMLLVAGPTLVGAKLVMIILALLFTGTVATHALARAALQDGVQPVLAGKSGKLTACDAAEAVQTLKDLVRTSTPKADKDSDRAGHTNTKGGQRSSKR